MIGNKIANKITKVLRSSLQNKLETITTEHDKEISKERYISPEETLKIIDDHWHWYNSILMDYQKNNKFIR